MRLTPVTRRKRPGFTLLEVIVVIVIILILASLILAATVRALAKAREVRNRNDISQLSTALENFKGKFGFYPPSRIRLCKLYGQYTNLGVPGIDADSVQYLTRMFPHIDLNSWAVNGIDWDGTGNRNEPPSLLEGDQCLVFFLGGIPRQPAAPVPGACMGFSTNPSNPALGSADRIGPFYEFLPARLVLANLVGTPIHPNAPFYFTYADAYATTDGVGTIVAGAPFAYFSSYKTTNGYNRYGNSDCPTLTLSPYWQVAGTPNQYVSPNSYQIISAGKDGRFGGGGGPWSPATASNYYPDGTPGRDDQASFYDSPLGVENK
jgi:prepilin-type N-terminal cleavage/methylation domain-containing protein